MQIGDICIKIFLIIFLAVCTVFDIRNKEIPLALILAGLSLAAGVNIWQVFTGAESLGSVGASLLCGLFFLLLGFVTKEKVGYGDGIILVIAGLLMDSYRCFVGLCISLILSSVFAIVLLVMQRADRNSALPFVPFIAIGMGVGLFV